MGSSCTYSASVFVFRLPKVKLGKILLAYWALVLVAVQRTRCVNIIRKICLHSNVILIGVALIQRPSFNKSKPVPKRKLPKQHRFHHQVIFYF